MNEQEIIALLAKYNALIDNDHFVYVSGHHGAGWVAKDRIFIHPDLIAQLTQSLINLLDSRSFDVIAGPSYWGFNYQSVVGDEA